MIILSNVSAFASGMYSIEDLNGMNIQANSSISKSDYKKAQKIMKEIYEKTTKGANNGVAPKEVKNVTNNTKALILFITSPFFYYIKNKYYTYNY